MLDRVTRESFISSAGQTGAGVLVALVTLDTIPGWCCCIRRCDWWAGVGDKAGTGPALQVGSGVNPGHHESLGKQLPSLDTITPIMSLQSYAKQSQFDH